MHEAFWNGLFDVRWEEAPLGAEAIRLTVRLRERGYAERTTSEVLAASQPVSPMPARRLRRSRALSTALAIRRGSFTCVTDLIAAIEAFIDAGATAATPLPGPRPPTIYSRAANPVKEPRSHDTR